MGKCAFKINDRKCAILTQKQCMRCHFCKTVEEVQASRAKAAERLEVLPLAIRLRIAEKYKESEGGE